jgi:hypothetical protein
MEKISESFVMVEMKDNGYTICTDEEGNEMRSCDISSALELVDDLIDNYGGKYITIIKETIENIDTVYIPKI